MFRVYNPKICASLLKRSLASLHKKGARLSLSLFSLPRYSHITDHRRREKRENREREASNKEETFLVRFFPLPLLKQTGEESRVFNVSSSSSSF